MMIPKQQQLRLYSNRKANVVGRVRNVKKIDSILINGVKAADLEMARFQTPELLREISSLFINNNDLKKTV